MVSKDPKRTVETLEDLLAKGTIDLHCEHYGTRGIFGQARNFNPDNDNYGWWVEGSHWQGYAESAGIFMNGNTMCLWSPGDNDILRVYDEDDFSKDTPEPRFVIDDIGSVGIGTPHPQADLHVKGTAQEEITRIFIQPHEWNSAGDYGEIRFGDANHYIRGEFDTGMTFRDINKFQFLGGNLGIRTDNPNAVLHVEGDKSDEYILRVRASGNTKLWVHGNGGTSIGMRTAPPANGLYVQGDAIKPGGGSWGSTSDERLKKNIKPLEGALDKLVKLRGVSYEWKEPQKHGNLTGEQIGLIAQEVGEVFPGWISEDPDGYKILTIRGFEALSIEAFKELKAENEKLHAEIKKLEARIEALEKKT